MSAVSKAYIYLPILAISLFSLSNLTSCGFKSVSTEAAETIGEQNKPIALEAVPVSEEACAPQACFKSALELKGKGLQKDYVLRLTEIRERFPSTVWSARASLLLGVESLEAAMAEEAINYLKDAETIEEIKDYVHLFNARASALKKEPQRAIIHYDAILVGSPDSVLAVEALFKKAELLFDAGDYRASRDILSKFIELYPKSSFIPEAMLKAAKASFELKDYESAVKYGKELCVRFPANGVSKGAEELFAKIKAVGKEVAELTVEERFQRGERLFNATHYRSAAKEFDRIAHSAKGEYRDRAYLKNAMSRLRLKEYGGAEKILDSYLKLKNIMRQEEALYSLALVALRRGDEKALLEIEKKISKNFPKSEKRGGVLVLVGKYYEGEKEFDKAIEYYRQVTEYFSRTEHAESVKWSMAWLNYRAGRYEEAYKSFMVSGRDEAQFIYWAARSAEKMGNTEEAVRLYEGVCSRHVGSYYCGLAEARAEGLKEALGIVQVKEDETVHVNAATETIEAIGFVTDEEGMEPEPDAAQDSESAMHPLFSDSHYLAASELLTLGLNAYAGGEIDALTNRYSKDDGALREITALFYGAGDYFRALRIYRMFLADTDSADSRSLGYPKDIVHELKDKADAEVDPHLVAAVIREESSFNPKAVSVTGALGLMQIMPATGRLISRELGRDFQREHLFNPDVNIRFGSWYLGHLIKRFDNNIVLAVAGYNAGPNAVDRWVQTLPQEPDEFIEAIPYPETRNYTKKVLKSYAEFRRISGEKKAWTTGIPEKASLIKFPAEVKNTSGINPG